MIPLMRLFTLQPLYRFVAFGVWEMADDDGPDVAEEFYKHMFCDSGGARDCCGT
jgi:hypothetical protein